MAYFMNSIASNSTTDNFILPDRLSLSYSSGDDEVEGDNRGGVKLKWES